MRAPILSLLASCLAAAGLVMAGERPDAKLTYARKPGATICPDEPLMRQLVAARLGYDPFRNESKRAIAVTITREPKGFRAVLEMRDAAGTVVGTRILTSTSSDCNELASSIALALSIAIDPLGDAPAPSASASASATPVPTSAPPIPTIALAPPPASSASAGPPPPRPLWPFAGVGGIAAIAAAPDLAFGLTTVFGLHADWYSVAIEGRVDAEASKRAPAGGEVTSSIVAGAIVPCLHRDVLMVCGIAAYGSLRGVGSGVRNARRSETPWSALGARVGLEATVFGPFALRAHADVLAVTTRTTLQIDKVDAWTTPPVSVLLGLGVVAHFR